MIERKRKILELVENRGEVDIPALRNFLGVSEATVRRDLLALENSGNIVRKMGGICTLAGSSFIERTFHEKRNKSMEEKMEIAKTAAQFIEPGMTLAIDSGSSTWQIATELKNKAPLVILTNMLGLVERLGAVEGIEIFLTGGMLRKQNLDFVGSKAAATFKELHADVAFIAADSYIIGKGAFSFDEDSAVTAAAIGRCADQCILTIDHSKFNRRGYCMILPNVDFDYIITDSGIDQETRLAIQKEPCQVIF